MRRFKTIRRLGIIVMVMALAVVSINGVSGADVVVPQEPVLDPVTDPVTEPVGEVIDEVGGTVEDTVNPSSDPPPPEEEPSPAPEEESGQSGSGITEENAGGTTSSTGNTSPGSTIDAQPVPPSETSSAITQKPASVTTESYSSEPLVTALDMESLAQPQSIDHVDVALGPRSTVQIVDMLERANASPTTIAQILAPFPVAGRASYSNDWGQERFDPYFHLHEGTDIFADRGTPVTACAAGVVSNMTPMSAAGGTSLRVTASDGTYCYYAHLEGFAFSVFEGKSVALGETIGYVGTSGNAEGGLPHLHFEIHLKGGDASPPVPYLDRWIVQAQAEANAYVATHGTSPLHVIKMKLAGAVGALRPQIVQVNLDAASSTRPFAPPLLVPVVGAAIALALRRRRKTLATASGENGGRWWLNLP